MFLLAQHKWIVLATEFFTRLLSFSLIVAIIIFIVRVPLRTYKTADISVLNKMVKWRSPQLSAWMKQVTFLGKHQFLIPANLLLILVLQFLFKESSWAFTYFSMAVSSLLLMFLFKWLFQRRRPADPYFFKARGKSFPSGHAMMSVCFYGLILLHISSVGFNAMIVAILYVILGVLIFLIGLSRVYLGVHYLSDVLAGFIIGYAWLMIGSTFFMKLAQS